MLKIIDKYNIDEVDGILLNMNAGLLPIGLDKHEVELLEKRFGINWFNELGFTEPKYQRSPYDNYNNTIF